MKTCVIIPYFGNLPDHFDLWYESCANNKSIDWVLITDVNRHFPPVENIRVINNNINWINDLIKNKINYKYKIENPYKLCDYKPLYGILFEDLLDGYDYWGYCDMDLIFGDIESYFSKEFIIQYDTMQIWGHFTLIKNDPIYLNSILNELNDNFDLEKILQSKIVWAIDEYALPAINEKMGKKIYINYEIIADIIPFRKKLGMYNGKRYIFKYEKGKVIGYYLDESQNLKSEEYMYIHFQKRRLLVNENINNSEYYIVDNEFTTENINIKEILMSKENLFNSISLKIIKNVKTLKKVIALLKEGNLVLSIRYRSTSKKIANSEAIKLKN